MRIAVVGGGIIGLSSAVLLQESGHEVCVFSHEDVGNITSSVAAAVVYPYGVEESARMQDWLARSISCLQDLKEEADAGVSVINWRKCAYDSHTRIAPFFYTLPNARALSAEECPQGFAKGVAAELFMISSKKHMPYLLARFKKAGGTYLIEYIESLSILAHGFDLIVNASGVYASDFVTDTEVRPGRGQVVIVRNPGLDYHFSTFEGRHYIYPRGDECILGGSMDFGEWDCEPNPELTRTILNWAAEFDPRFYDAEILDVRVGLRPMRATVRLECDKTSCDVPVIHNYGHGGAGYTLAWGCADVVREMVSHLYDGNTVADNCVSKDITEDTRKAEVVL